MWLGHIELSGLFVSEISKNPLYLDILLFYPEWLTRLRLWLACVHKESYLSAAHNTFMFPGMVGREMAKGRGHAEMGKGGGRGVGYRSGDGEACRRWLGGNREREKVS